MLCTVGLPTHVYSRLTQWFSRATDEGILEELAVVPPEVLAADPGAQRAWCWLLKLMREQVLGSVLQAEREKVESSVLELRAYHAPRRSTRMLVSAAERRRASMRGSVGSLGSSVGSLGSAGSWGSSAEGGGSPSERALCAELERERERCRNPNPDPNPNPRCAMLEQPLNLSPISPLYLLDISPISP